MKHILRQVVIAAGLVVGTSLLTAASAQTIVDEWATVKVPPPPELKPVTIENVKETAFLVLDIQRQNCNNQRRPRCVASVPKIQKFLEEARAKGMPVIYSRTSQSTVADILPEVDSPIRRAASRRPLRISLWGPISRRSSKKKVSRR